MAVRVGNWFGLGGGGLQITSIKNGQITGKYRSNLGNVKPEDLFFVTGFTDGTIIAFSTLWRNESTNAHSATSWTGRWLGISDSNGLGDKTRERLELQWTLHRLYDDNDQAKKLALWESTLSGYSILYWTP